MNTNEYIEKYSTLQVDKKTNQVVITMCVPPRLQVEFVYQECEESKLRRIQTNEIQNYLKQVKKLNVSTIDNQSNNSILNSHPDALTATWVFTIEKSTKRTKKPSTK